MVAFASVALCSSIRLLLLCPSTVVVDVWWYLASGCCCRDSYRTALCFFTVVEVVEVEVLDVLAEDSNALVFMDSGLKGSKPLDM